MAQKIKTILVLGGYGFLGTNIMKYIDAHLKSDYQCIVFDKFSNHPHGVHFECVSRIYSGDFCDRELLNRIFKENTIDIVLHTLSTTIPVSTSSARYDVETNLLPTIDILGLMVEYNIKHIVYISSGGAVYGTRENKPHLESDAVYPMSSYGVVKLATEKYMMQYAQLYGIRPLIIRLSNPYGPYHYGMRQGVINIAIAKALKAEKFSIWGDGEGRKDYIYVDDFVEILFELLLRGVENQVINVGSGQLLSVNNIVSYIRKYVPELEEEHVDAQKTDASYFELDTTKLHNSIGNYSFTSIEDGIKNTFEWTKRSL